MRLADPGYVPGASARGAVTLNSNAGPNDPVKDMGQNEKNGESSIQRPAIDTLSPSRNNGSGSVGSRNTEARSPAVIPLEDDLRVVEREQRCLRLRGHQHDH